MYSSVVLIDHLGYSEYLSFTTSVFYYRMATSGTWSLKEGGPKIMVPC